jgi:molybdopterin-guanine dinucleotide biosynthesis protein A
MGRPKAWLLYEGEPLYRRTLTLLREVTGEVLVASRSLSLTLPPWARMVEDRAGISGPLAGILGGMEKATGSHLLVVGVDFPFLTSGFLRDLLKRSEEMEGYGVVPCVGGVWQPLVAVYPVSFQKTIERWLKISGSVSPRQFLDDHRDRVIAVTERDGRDLPRLLWNLNTPEEYDALLSTPQGNLPP